MDTLWLLVALWIGFLGGFFLFALMSIARDKPMPMRETVRYAPLQPRRAHH